MKVSVITVTYNSSCTLSDAMMSVLNQTYGDIEYIVVDGASTDGTLDIIQQYEPLFEGRMKWSSAKDHGIYDAMNKGIRLATGDVVGILNSDDYFTSNDVLERMVSTFEDANVDAVYGDIHFIHDGRPDKCFGQYGCDLDLCQLIPRSIAVARCLSGLACIRPTMLSVLTTR